MKTPREILLERHRNAAQKLDVIRSEVVSAELKGVGRASRPSPFERITKTETGATPVLQLLWRELILPSRRIWAGLAAVWVLLLAANVSLRDRSAVGTVASAPPQMMLSFQQQERLLTELIGPDETSAAEPATPFLPLPRSEGRLEILMT
jgi:hypothetical protein